MNKYMLGILLALGVSFAFANTPTKTEPKKDEIVCIDNTELDKTMVEKGFDILFNMTNNNGVVESVWYGGNSIVITAAVPNEKKSCFLAAMSNVTYNPKSIEEIWETYKKQTKQRDI